jgi:hypothetical protein
MQTIVGMLLMGRADLGAPLSQLSPWLDMLIRDDEAVFGLLEAQREGTCDGTTLEHLRTQPRPRLRVHLPGDGRTQRSQVCCPH